MSLVLRSLRALAIQNAYKIGKVSVNQGMQ